MPNSNPNCSAILADKGSKTDAGKKHASLFKTALKRVLLL
jgi:hypothetical protein